MIDDRPELKPWLLELVATEIRRRDEELRLRDELEEYADHVLGPTTTEYSICGRIGGVPYHIKINPLHYARRLIADELLAAWREVKAPIVPVPHWTTWPESQQLNRKKAYTRLCRRHAELLAEGDPWAAYERDALAFLDEFDARWHVPVAVG